MSPVSATKRWWRANGLMVRAFSLFCLVALSIACDVAFEKDANGNNIVWFANGLTLAYILLAPRWRMVPYLLSGLAGMVAGSCIVGESWRDNLMFNSFNMVEVLIAALLLKRKSSQLPIFTDGKYLLRFIGFGCVVAPVLAGVGLAACQTLLYHTSYLRSLESWFVGDSLGIAVIAPTFVAILQSRFRNTHLLRKAWYYPALLLAVTVLVFSQTYAPLLFLVYPFLMLVVINIDLGWAAICTLMVALIGGWYTVHGAGPVGLAVSLSGEWKSAVLQLFLASALFMLYTVSTVFESLRRTQNELKQIAALHKLVVDNSRDIIVLGSLEGRFEYVSPGVRALSGWDPGDLDGKLFQETIHPSDLPEVEMALRAMQAGSPGGTLEYRFLKSDGTFLWVEANLRVYLDPVTGLSKGFLNLVRDISERKRAEQNLQTAYRAMETLVVVDALTGIANRRRFDDAIATEWRRSLRLGSRLSMLLIDVDQFKAYNDTYGHVRGDSCLKQIAEAALDVVVRPADLVARYGGEEFAVILPGTDEAGALAVAEEICRAVRRRNLAHEKNPHGIVTVSIGCATVTPKRGLVAKDLIEFADKALYAAKGSGRNRVAVASRESLT